MQTTALKHFSKQKLRKGAL